MRKYVDINGKRFGRLVVLWHSYTLNKKYGSEFYECICDCGVRCVKKKANIITGDTRSCGCLKKESIGNVNRSHSLTGTKEYVSWMAIKSRCYYPKNNRYAKYGARGITVCQRWKDSFENFLSDMGYAPSPKHSVDRVDVNAGYGPENCRWATTKEQSRNTTRTRLLEYNGQKKTLGEWLEVFGLKDEKRKIYQRIHKLGWSLENALEIKKHTNPN